MVEVRVNARDLERLVRRAPQAVDTAVRRGVNNGITLFEEGLDKRFRSYRGRSYARHLQTRSGALRGSFVRRVEGRGSETVGRVFTFSKYARLQEYGGTITPKNRKYLRIPLSGALRANGTPIGGLEPVRGSGANGQARWQAADGTKTFVAKSKAGNLIVFNSETKTPLFVLKESVTVPPRLGFFDTWRRVRPRAREEVARQINLELERLGRRGR